MPDSDVLIIYLFISEKRQRFERLFPFSFGSSTGQATFQNNIDGRSALVVDPFGIFLGDVVQNWKTHCQPGGQVVLEFFESVDVDPSEAQYLLEVWSGEFFYPNSDRIIGFLLEI